MDAINTVSVTCTTTNLPGHDQVKADSIIKQMKREGLTEVEIKSIAERMVAMLSSAPSNAVTTGTKTDNEDLAKNAYSLLLPILFKEEIIINEDDLDRGKGETCCKSFFTESTLWKFANILNFQQIKRIAVSNNIHPNHVESIHEKHLLKSNRTGMQILRMIRGQGKCLHKFMIDVRNNSSPKK